MKKTLCFVLLLTMLLGLSACGKSDTQPDTPKGLQSGFGREIVMPADVTKVHLNGTDTAGRVSTGFLDYIKVTCIALRDAAGTTVLLYTMDMLGVTAGVTDELRPMVAEATGVPGENIIFCATHTHSAPVTTGSYAGAAEYKTIVFDGAVKAAQDAISDLSYSEISYGSTFTQKQVFVRHYVHRDGKITASSGITDINNIVGHPTEADEEMQIIRLTRPAEDKKDIILMSWNSHPTFHGGVKDDQISADFPGPTRDYIEANGDYLVGYFTGDAGNQAPTSKIKEENHGMDYREFGEKLGQICLDALPTLKSATGDTIQLTNHTYVARANKERLDMLPQAKEVLTVYENEGRDAANALAAQYDLYQHLEARAIVRRSNTGNTHDIPMTTLSVGDNVSFVFAPYEMFTNHGHDLRVRGPYDITFVSSCSQGSNSYIPSQEAFDYGCYESYVAVVAPGTGEELVEEYLKLLNAMKGQ